jgi:Tol biopolymer transport system component
MVHGKAKARCSVLAACIAFTSPGGDIWLAGSKGQNQERIGHITWARDTVSWSPDSQKILFSDKDETLTLYYLGSKTTGPLTRTDFKAHTPRWSPDGTVIVAIVGRGIESELYIIDSNGSNPQRVTMNNLQEEMPDWSVNSQEIVYDAEVDDTFAVFVMNRDGTNIRRLSNSNYSARFPSVASTAGSIVYVLNRRERNEIAVMDWNGANFSVLTNNNDDEVMPTWRR